MISRKYDELSNVTGKIIKKLRKSQNMSRETLSTKLMILGIDINRDGIYRLEVGKRIIKDFELSAIAVVLNVSEAEMLQEFREKLLEE